MRLIGIAVIVAVSLVLAPLAASAQQAVPRVRVLRSGNPPPGDLGHRYQAKPISVKGFLRTVREMLPSR